MSNDRGGAIVFSFFVWGLAGALFGSLFAGLHQVLLLVGLEDWQSLLVSAGAAAMTTSAFYSSMPVALVGTMAGVLASIGYLIWTGHQVKLLAIAGIAAGAGVIAGEAYAWMSKGGARPLAQTLTGLISGVVAGSVLALGLSATDLQIGAFGMAAVVVALVGGLFQLSRRWVLSISSDWCPRRLSAPLVAGLIAAVVGASVWIMGGTTAIALDEATKGAIDEVLAGIPSGFFGGMLGGAVTGVLLEIMGMTMDDPRAFRY